MQFKTMTLVGLAALCSLGAQAQKKKKVGRKVIPAEKIVAAKSIVKAVPADSFSYAAGLFQSGSLSQYLQSREGITEDQFAEVARGLQATITPEEKKKLFAYVAGLRIAQMNNDNIFGALNQAATGKKDAKFLNEALFVKGLIEGLTKAATMKDSVAEGLYNRQMEFVKQETAKRNQQFMLDYAKNHKDAKRTDSGLLYRVLTPGTGVVATDTNTVEVHYEGKLTDGTIFDSSYQRNQTAEFKPGQVIKGWTEALKMMPEGSIWELVIPSELAYGEREAGAIPANSTLVFKVHVVKVK